MGIKMYISLSFTDLSLHIVKTGKVFANERHFCKMTYFTDLLSTEQAIHDVLCYRKALMYFNSYISNLFN